MMIIVLYLYYPYITKISLQDRQQTLPLRKVEHVQSELVNGHSHVKRDNADNPPPPPPVRNKLPTLFESNGIVSYLDLVTVTDANDEWHPKRTS